MQIFTLQPGEELLVGDIRITVVDVEGDEVLLEIVEGESVRRERLKAVACEGT